MDPNKVFRRPVVPEQKKGRAPDIEWRSIYDAWIFKVMNVNDRKDGILSPSEGLGFNRGLCERRLVYKLLFTEKQPMKNWPETLRRYENGTQRHKEVLDRFGEMAKAGFMSITEAKIEHGLSHHSLPIEGTCDALVKVDGWWYLLDFKTMASKSCAKTMSIGPTYKIQLNTYMGLAGVNVGYVIYENKDNNQWLPSKYFRHDFDENMYAETEEFAEEMAGYAKKKQLPVFQETQCRNDKDGCPYVAICERDRA